MNDKNLSAICMAHGRSGCKIANCPECMADYTMPQPQQSSRMYRVDPKVTRRGFNPNIERGELDLIPYAAVACAALAVIGLVLVYLSAVQPEVKVNETVVYKQTSMLVAPPQAPNLSFFRLQGLIDKRVRSLCDVTIMRRHTIKGNG